jgi:cysteine desulfuration protein SufE
MNARPDPLSAASAAVHEPGEETAQQAQETIAEEFAFFGDWTERYQYLIDLGRKLPPFPPELQTDAHKVQGCQSQVWLVAEGDPNRLSFRATSDSAIVSGLIALLLRVYSGRSAQEIIDTEPDYIAAIGLAKHLPPTRSNGLAAMLATIKQYARATLEKA